MITDLEIYFAMHRLSEDDQLFLNVTEGVARSFRLDAEVFDDLRFVALAERLEDLVRRAKETA